MITYRYETEWRSGIDLDLDSDSVGRTGTEPGPVFSFSYRIFVKYDLEVLLQFLLLGAPSWRVNKNKNGTCSWIIYRMLALIFACGFC